MLLDRSATCITRCILLAGRLTIAVKPITLENLLVIEDGIYTPPKKLSIQLTSATEQAARFREPVSLASLVLLV